MSLMVEYDASMIVAPRPLVSVPASDGAELGVQLPRLKNWEIANWDFIDHGICATHPKLDFFSGAAATKEECKALCRQCPVVDACQKFSIVTEQEFGIWGGLDEKERKPMIKEMRKELAG